ncbi:hypothetical protein [Vreelandella aquamarina]|uniref:hypothetical protein n=1 Tax=Vreelandella aquamarina TaxID=77097 RepID=UPI001D177130|nr:hypothetical protein [Halomonas axialensis]MCC4290647.1 hypothetical protein [Halomonas axialensis]
MTGYDGADVSLSTFLNDAGFDGRSSTVQDALTSEAVADAEKTVSDFKTAIDAVDGLSLAVRTYNNAQEAQIAAGEALDDAQADTLGAITTFENRTGLTLTFSDGTNPVTVDGNQDITTVAEVTDGTNTLLTVANGEFVIEASAADVEGINTLQATLQSEYDAQVAADAAAQAVIDADAALDALDAEVAAEDFVKASDGTTPVDTGLGVANELAAREETLTDLTAAIERFENARSLSNELESLDEAVTDAESAITDSEADGGLGVDLFTSDDVAAGPPATLTVDAGDDVVLFSEELDGVEIQSFASSGEDRLFFGEGFELVELTEAWDATADTGDSAVQEIFWAEASGNLTLYVENKAFAGNASGADDITEIQLTGVSAADIEFSGGYLSAGEPA